MSDIGRFLIVVGVVLVGVGLLLTFVPRVGWLGRLPGDIHVERGNWTIYVPLATSLLLSVALTLTFSIIGWLSGRR